MKKTALKRIIHSGFLNFQRNNWLSTASILVMTLVLLMTGGLVFLHSMTTHVLSSLSDKIDVSVYLKMNTLDSQVAQLKSDLLKLPEVKDVVYVSQDDALARFKETHKQNALILDSLAELDKNPLQASINIKASETADLGKISNYLADQNYSFIDKINFFENKALIERLGALVAGVRSGGILLAIFFALVALLVAFNTIRMAIYTNREEIHVMKLVGASHWYIRGPFIVEGIIEGVLSALIAMAILFPIAWALSPKISTLIPDFDLFQYFQSNAILLFTFLLSIGVLLGIVSSIIAIRRYLKEVE